MRSALIAAVSASLLATAFAPLATTSNVTSAATSTATIADLANAPGVGGFSSSNLEYVATLATDAPGVGGRVHEMPDGSRRFYVSSVQGLRIYDIDDPGLPVLIGAFEVPNWENEDVSVSKDGKTVLMSEFTGTGYTYVFQVSDPGTAGLVTISLGDALPLSAAHIVDCIDDACNYFYGAEGQIWDARDKKNVTELAAAKGWGEQIKTQLGGTYAYTSGHNLEVVGDRDLDGDGDLERVAIADTTPIVMMDVTDPTTPKLIATSDTQGHTFNKTAYQHNNKVFGFEDYAPRGAQDEPVRFDKGKPTNLRTGELLLGNGETNFGPRCGSGSGPLTSWSAAGWEKGGKAIQPIATFRPVNGTYDGPDGSGGDPAVNAIGCSGHWFDVRADDADADDIIVAAAWYEHGTRIIRVDGATGAFEQLGFFQPVAGSASAAHWIVDEESGVYVYTVDYVRGVDILKYDPDAPVESTDTFDASWFLNDASVTQLSAQKRYFCRLGAGAPVSEAATDVVLAEALRRR